MNPTREPGRTLARAATVGREELALPVASGLLLVASFPPFQLLVPPFVALVPLILSIADRPSGAAGRWGAVRGGYLAGLVYFGLLLYWLVVALIQYSWLAIPAYVLTVLVLAAFTAAFSAGLHYVCERTPVPLAFAATALWTATEWVQGHLGDLSFPWLGLGTAVASFPRVAGAADLVGARGLTFWLALVNGLIASAILAYRAGRPVRRVASATVLTIALPVAYGAWRVATLEPRPAASVAVLQPNIAEDVKMRRDEAVDSTLAAVRRLMGRITAGSVDLVAWPEVALPAVLEPPYEPDLRAEVRHLSERMGAPIVVGAYGARSGADGDVTLFNSAYMVAPTGFTGAVYDKRRLVPFVERVPFVDPSWLAAVTGDVRYFGGLGRGAAAPIFTAGQSPFGVLICYESIFADLSRRYRLAGVDFLVNITNDAWYGGAPWYRRTTALWQHPAHLSMRAIETRVGIARAANTGISLFVDPLGRTYERTDLFVPDARAAAVYTTDGITLFTLWGDWLGTGATIAAALLLLVARLVGRGASVATGTGERPRGVAGPAPRWAGR